jgi:hypothetical protein
MKLSKKLIVTGLLFSSVLGSVNVGSITAMAAINVNNIPKPEGPAVSNPENAKPSTPEVVEPDKGDPDPIEITHPENVRKISIVFASENGGDIPMPHSTLEVTKDAKSLKESNITLPSGYELVTNQDLTIKKVGNLEYVKVKIKKINAAEQQESVKLNFVDDKGFSITDSKLPKTVNVKKNSTKLELKNVKLPQGYKFANNADVFIKNGEATIKVEKANVVKVNVIYVDKDTKKTISSVKLSGSYGTANKLDIPAGYKVVDGSSNVVKFGKDGAVVTVVVEKVTPITNHKSTITTYPGSFVSLYNQKGQYIQNRGLGENSSWASDKTMVLDGVKYYRVSTNEWVKAEAVYEYTPMANKTITTTKGSFKKLYTTRGKAVGNRGLGANSSWLTDKAATINGETMYRVATNEWIKASDIK